MRGTAARDTIFALSSGAPPAAIAVVRVSGPGADEALRALAGRLPAPRIVSLASLRDKQGGLLDRALVLWLPGPATATGEDMAELQIHGGRAVLAAVLEALGGLAGCRPAEAGEFTRRAFANGRLDLTQAEGLAELLAAETEAQRRQAVRSLEGGLARLIDRWREALLGLSAHVEAAIEFGEEEADVPPLTADDRRSLEALAGEIDRALAEPPAERLRDGVRVVVAGPVNAGKSSLINALAEREAAIATAIPGTTRDLIEVPIALGGYPFLLTDSAGLREAEDPVERIGVDRARAAMEGADIVLWLGEADEAPPGLNRLVIHAQADRPDRASLPRGAALAVSAVTGQGMAELRTLLLERARAITPAPDAVATNQRQRELLGHALMALRAARSPSDPVLVAEELRMARAALDRITGRSGVEDMLDALFGRFCIGK